MQRLDDRSRMSGDVHVRFCESLRGRFPWATRLVCMFKNRRDAENFYRWLPDRMAKFNLELAPDKTQIVSFTGKPFTERFTFLGFEFYRGLTKRRKVLAYARTSPKKMNISLAGFKEWFRRNRSLGTSAIFEKVRLKLAGHYNYYGVAGNFEMLARYYYFFTGILKKYLNRRSQRSSCNWEKFHRLVRIYGLPQPRIKWSLKDYPLLWKT